MRNNDGVVRFNQETLSADIEMGWLYDLFARAAFQELRVNKYGKEPDDVDQFLDAMTKREMYDASMYGMTRSRYRYYEVTSAAGNFGVILVRDGELHESRLIFRLYNPYFSDLDYFRLSAVFGTEVTRGNSFIEWPLLVVANQILEKAQMVFLVQLRVFFEERFNLKTKEPEEQGGEP